MYHSLTISDWKITINTYDDWYLAPTSRPSFSPPSFSMQTLEIPGRDGLLDVTTSLTKFPTFGNRSGSFEFLIHPDSPYTWYETYQKVANHLHGQTKSVSLEDDPAYWYEGRFWLNDFKSGEKYSTITLNYSVQPYKKSKWTTLDTWDIDPFNLDRPVSSWFKDLIVSSDDYVETFDTISQFGDDIRQEIVGRGSVSPILIVESDDRNGIDISFRNEELGIFYTAHLNDGENEDPNIIFSMNYPNNWMRISAKGHGKLSIKYNIRSL